MESEKQNIVEFIKHLNNDDFSNAEKSLRSVVDEKIKNKMKEQMIELEKKSVK